MQQQRWRKASLSTSLLVYDADRSKFAAGMLSIRLFLEQANVCNVVSIKDEMRCLNNLCHLGKQESKEKDEEDE